MVPSSWKDFIRSVNLLPVRRKKLLESLPKPYDSFFYLIVARSSYRYTKALGLSPIREIIFSGRDNYAILQHVIIELLRPE